VNAHPVLGVFSGSISIADMGFGWTFVDGIGKVGLVATVSALWSWTQFTLGSAAAKSGSGAAAQVNWTTISVTITRASITHVAAITPIRCGSSFANQSTRTQVTLM
jgi:hypothetical protein